MLNRHEQEITQCKGRTGKLENRQWSEWLQLLARHRRAGKTTGDENADE